MKLKKYEKSTFFYLAFFIILSVSKGIGLDSNDFFFIILAILACILLSIKILNDKYTMRELVVIIIMLGLGSIILIESKKTTILMTIISIVFAKNIPFKDIMKSVFVVRLVSFTIVILMSLCGIVENVKQYRVEENGELITRYSLGFTHPNITYLNFLIIIVLYLYINYEKIRFKQYVYIICLAQIVYIITDSRTGFITIILSIIVDLLLKSKKMVKNKLVKLIIILIPSICAMFSILGSVYYSANFKFLNIINTTISGRLELSKRFLTMYDIKLFGQHILEGSNLSGSYLRIDNGYISLLLGYGIVIFIIYIIAQTVLIKKYLSENKYKEILLIIIFLVYGITEVYIYNIFVNVSLLFFSDLIFRKKNNKGGIK